MTSQHQVHHSKRRGISRLFTLIEMLIVIGIVSILIGMGAAAIIKLSQGSGVKQAVTAISGKLSVARSLAASRNAYVAVVFPIDAKSTPDDLASRCAMILEVEKDGDDVSPKDFIPGQDWTMMPPNTILLAEASGEDESATGRLITQMSDGFKKFKNQSKGSGLAKVELRMGKERLPQSMPAIVFNPQGQPETKELTGVILYVAEGRSSDGKTVTGNLANRRMIVINPFTGRVKVYEDENEDNK